jgi:hypothetical protein
MIFSRIISLTFASYALFGYSTDSLAWSADGHTSIGIMAINQLQAESRRELESIIGPLDDRAMEKACNWPDEVRETEEWEWSARLHYINIPRGDFVYRESRDCPDQLCATQGIKRFAVELANQEATGEQRMRAFAWLCHLVGDLHQPLHAGFEDDRGGNNFDIIFKGEQINLHGFWDFELINEHAGSWQNLVKLLSTSPATKAASNWSPEMVNDWTNESHELAKQSAYPATKNIDETYVQQSWERAQKQISSAATHLALIINTQLQNRD